MDRLATLWTDADLDDLMDRLPDQADTDQLASLFESVSRARGTSDSIVAHVLLCAELLSCGRLVPP